MNPVIAVPAPLLSEEALSGSAGGEDEEGVVSDPGTEIYSESDSKIKVSCCCNVMCNSCSMETISISKCTL